MQPPPAIYWHRRARWTTLRYNLGCVLGAFLPACLGWSALFACLLLLVREQGTIRPVFWMGYGAGWLACLGFAWWHVRGRLFTFHDALTRLDWHLGLHNRLTAAVAGIGDYPAPRDGTNDGYFFRWQRIIPPLAGAIALVWVAAALPLSHRAAAFVPVAPPVAWTQAARWIDTLQKGDLLQTPALEEIRERLDQLHQQPAREWYSQSSLEAGDSLREQTAQAIETLDRDLRTALGDVETMSGFNDQTSPAEARAVRDNLDNALKGLELGTLPLNRELLDQLKAIDPSTLKTLTPAQMAELQRRLKAGAQVCRMCLHPGEAGDGEPKGIVLAQGSAPHDGKFVRGGGTEPLTLNEKPTELSTTARDSVSNPDLDHSLPGDIVGVGKGEHKIDPSKYAGPASGGAVASPGEGGEAVWRDDLNPNECEVLKKFFK